MPRFRVVSHPIPGNPPLSFVGKRSSAILVLEGLAACGQPGATRPRPGPPSPAPDPFDASRNSITCAVMDGAPYGRALTAEFPTLIANINDDPAMRRGVHVGDSKGGSTLCSDEWFDDIRDRLEDSGDPLVHVPATTNGRIAH